jgi:hypothetical protein
LLNTWLPVSIVSRAFHLPAISTLYHSRHLFGTAEDDMRMCTPRTLFEMEKLLAPVFNIACY